MRVIIAGSREIRYLLTTDYVDMVAEVVAASGWRDEITCVISGGARGIDTAGEAWARREGIPVIRYPADWDKHGKAAGPIRNELMAQNADALLAVWDGVSRGTADMIRRARKHGLKVHIYQAMSDKAHEQATGGERVIEPTL